MTFEGNRKLSKHISGVHAGTIDNIRVINSALLGHSQKKHFKEEATYIVDVERFASKSGLSKAKAYDKALELLKPYLKTIIQIDRGKGVIEHTSLIHSIVEETEELRLSVIWHKDVIPYISGEMRPGDFITYDSRMDSVSSSYRYRLYMCLIRRLHTIKDEESRFKVTIRELKEEIELPEGRYKVYNDFYKRVIAPALDDIMMHTGVSLVAKGVTLRRKTHWVEFSSGRLIDL